MAEPDSRKTDEPDLVMEFEVEQDHPEDGGSSSSDDSEYSDEDQGELGEGLEEEDAENEEQQSSRWLTNMNHCRETGTAPAEMAMAIR